MGLLQFKFDHHSCRDAAPHFMDRLCFTRTGDTVFRQGCLYFVWSPLPEEVSMPLAWLAVTQARLLKPMTCSTLLADSVVLNAAIKIDMAGAKGGFSFRLHTHHSPLCTDTQLLKI